MRCENVYRTCSEQSALIAVKEEGDEDCIWCARNGTLGYSIAYKERARCEGHIILDTCPPIITKVPQATTERYIHKLFEFFFAEFPFCPLKQGVYSKWRFFLVVLGTSSHTGSLKLLNPWSPAIVGFWLKPFFTPEKAFSCVHRRTYRPTNRILDRCLLQGWNILCITKTPFFNLHSNLVKKTKQKKTGWIAE